MEVCFSVEWASLEKENIKWRMTVVFKYLRTVKWRELNLILNSSQCRVGGEIGSIGKVYRKAI